MTGTGARRARHDDADEVVAILVGAFFSDPTWSWAFPDPGRRVELQRWMWGLLVDGALRYPWVWLSHGNTSTSVWIPPDGTELTAEQEASFEPALVERSTGADASRVLGALEMFEQAHPRTEPHYYLSLLATRPEQTGHGYGLGLLADNLREIDQHPAPAYLEASNPGNVPLYRRYGFEVHGSFQLPDGGPEVVTMWREATPAGQAR